MESPFRKELDIAFGALRQAAKLSQHLVNSRDKGAVTKNDQSPVTIADFAIQALLAATFKSAFPNDTLVGEEDAGKLRQDVQLLETVWELLQWLAAEDKDVAEQCTLPVSRQDVCDLIDQCGNSAPAGEGRTWIFDPIDGTKAFVSGHLYAINIGMLVDGEQSLGAVGCPNLSIDAKAPLHNEDVDPEGKGCIVYAVKGHGAYVRPFEENTTAPRRLSVTPITDTKDIRFVSCLGVYSALPGIHETIGDRLGAPAPNCDLIAWVLRWSSMALGLSNATVWVYKDRQRCGKVWDHAGAMLLYEEAGGEIRCTLGKKIDLKSGRLMDQNFGFVAGPKGGVFEKLLETTREAVKDVGLAQWLEESGSS